MKNISTIFKRITIAAFTLFCSFTFSQTKQFIYDYTFVTDSTNRANVVTERMILNINSEQSEYFSYNKYLADSTVLNQLRNHIIPPPQSKKKVIDRVIKNYKSKNITYISTIGQDEYIINQNLTINWKLHPEFITVLNYKAQKATAEFGGRKWTAWFTKDIPIQDGPYKFSGLPGLIVKIKDNTASHQFILAGIKNFSTTLKYPDLNEPSEIIAVSYPEYIKVYKTNRINPTAYLLGKVNADTYRELEIMSLKKIARDNNIIEIELLK